jgi:DNA-binding MarR family transcriptional regulator
MRKGSSLLDPLPLDNFKSKSSDRIAGRWTSEEVFCNGFLAVPTLFLQRYGSLKPYELTPSEAMFVLELMSFKWSSAHPFPSYKSIAARMGVSDKMVRRYAQQLETKGYLIREMRKNRTNRFDLTGLLNALHSLALREIEQVKSRSRAQLEGLDV